MYLGYSKLSNVWRCSRTSSKVCFVSADAQVLSWSHIRSSCTSASPTSSDFRILCLIGRMQALVFDWLSPGIKLDQPVRWDLRLYSRDPRIANCQVSHATMFSVVLPYIRRSMLCKKIFTGANESLWCVCRCARCCLSTSLVVLCVQVRKVLFEHEPRCGVCAGAQGAV